MKQFTLHSDNRIEVAVSGVPAPSALRTAMFATEREFATLARAWQGSRLVAIWNNLPGARPVARFTDRETAVRRIWRAIQKLTPADVRAGDKVPFLGAKGVTKTAVLVTLLRAPSGASLAAIMALTGWQAHTVRGFISGHLSKRLGLRVHSFKRDGKRIYQIRR